jgi:hypothetical protein
MVVGRREERTDSKAEERKEFRIASCGDGCVDMKSHFFLQDGRVMKRGEARRGEEREGKENEP